VSSSDIGHHLAPLRAAELASISAPAETSGSPATRGESRAIYAAMQEVMAPAERADRPARARKSTKPPPSLSDSESRYACPTPPDSPTIFHFLPTRMVMVCFLTSLPRSQTLTSVFRVPSDPAPLFPAILPASGQGQPCGADVQSTPKPKHRPDLLSPDRLIGRRPGSGGLRQIQHADRRGQSRAGEILHRTPRRA